MSGGWGAGGYGITGWGIGNDEDLRLVRVVPRRENVALLMFSDPVRITGVLDPFDGSVPKRYSFVPDPSSPVGEDGLAPRPVSAVRAERAVIEGSQGKGIYVTTDRRFSPYPTRYIVSVNNLKSVNGFALEPGYTSALMDGLQIPRVPQVPELIAQRGDIASPNYFQAASPDAVALPVDERGDYALDVGLDSYTKRVWRRLTTRRGGFAHLPSYGVGVPDQIKRLGKESTRKQLESEAEGQIAQEPETKSVSAVLEERMRGSGVWVFRLKIETTAGDTRKIVVPIA